MGLKKEISKQGQQTIPKTGEQGRNERMATSHQPNNYEQEGTKQGKNRKNGVEVVGFSETGKKKLNRQRKL